MGPYSVENGVCWCKKYFLCSTDNPHVFGRGSGIQVGRQAGELRLKQKDNLHQQKKNFIELLYRNSNKNGAANNKKDGRRKAVDKYSILFNFIALHLVLDTFFYRKIHQGYLFSFIKATVYKWNEILKYTVCSVCVLYWYEFGSVCQKYSDDNPARSNCVVFERCKRFFF